MRVRALAAVAPLALAATACGESPREPVDADGPFRIGATIDVGAAPHGIRFSPDGDTAWVALSGEGRIAVVDLSESAVVARWEAGDAPLDLVRVDGGWLVSQFRDSTLIRLDDEGRIVPGAVWDVGAGPSLFTPGTVRGETWITTEFSDRLWTVDTREGAPRGYHATGDRPYPADVMWDGSYAFVPNLDAGSVSVIDLLNGELDATVEACPGPPGGALTPDQVTYIVACGGSDEVAFINTASFAVTGRVSEGLGPRPFSVAVPGDGRHALVNNAGGSTVSVIDLESRTVVQRLEVGEQPIVLRVHPDGERVFVANEISGTLVELAPIAGSPGAESPASSGGEAALNEVVVLGMIHSGHETSELFSLEVVSELVREIDPDYWLTEIPPNRWDRAWAEFEATGTVEEPRVRRFPEYMEGLFPLSREMDFEVIPTAGWTEPMSDFRAAYLDAYSRDPDRAAGWAEYRAAADASAEALAAGAGDDPRWIHTDAYDEAYDIRMRTYARLFDADLGPGGWEAINASHWAYIEAGLDRHRGEGVRFLLTYGAGHKGPFLRELRKRDDIVLLDVAPFLDRLAAAPTRQRAPRRPSTDPVFDSSEHGDLAERLLSVEGGFFTPDGGLVLVDRTEIHMIDMASGEHRVVGREGGGPEEFRFIGRAVRTSNSVIVSDLQGGRIVSIGHDGDFGHSQSYLGVPLNSLQPRLVARHPDGSTVLRDRADGTMVRKSEGRYWRQARYVAVDADGGLRVVAETRGNERYSDTSHDRPVLFGHRTLEAATSDRLVVAETDQGSISVLDWRGVPVASIPMLPGVRLSADQVRRGRESDASQRQESRERIRELALDGRFPFPPSDMDERFLPTLPDWPANEVAPPIDEMLTDFDSRLWVRDYRLPGQDSVTWRVWDIDRERLLLTVSMDGEDRLLDARGDAVLLRRLDAFDAHQVVVTPLRADQAEGGS
ncbi:MAG: hypothetical protein OXJ54_03605 [Gemmatimonadetes bacterium]|nr:hypothetical protein [Candidatus Palauibacter rhopaloidicola]